LRGSRQLLRVILLSVQDAKHYHAVADDLVEDLVWKAPQNDATEVQVIEALPLWILFQCPHGDSDRIKELAA
jgi:hypothetical protein